MVGRLGVVRVGNAHEPRLRQRAHERELDVLGVPARGGEVVRDSRLAAVGDDLTSRVAHRGVAANALPGHAAVDLRAGVGVLVEVAVGLAGGERIGARGHCLDLQRLERPGARHLAGDHAAQVAVHVELVDRGHATTVHAHLDVTAVEPVAHAVEGRAHQPHRVLRVEADRRPEPRHTPSGRGGDDDPSAAALRDVDPARVERPAAHRGGPAHADVRIDRLEEHAHRLVGSRREAGALVVVGEDARILGVLERIAVGAVLAHPDAVAESGAADHVANGGVGRGWHGEQHSEGCQKGGTAHGSQNSRRSSR